MRIRADLDPNSFKKMKKKDFVNKFCKKQEINKAKIPIFRFLLFCRKKIFY